MTIEYNKWLFVEFDINNPSTAIPSSGSEYRRLDESEDMIFRLFILSNLDDYGPLELIIEDGKSTDKSILVVFNTAADKSVKDYVSQYLSASLKEVTQIPSELYMLDENNIRRDIISVLYSDSELQAKPAISNIKYYKLISLGESQKLTRKLDMTNSNELTQALGFRSVHRLAPLTEKISQRLNDYSRVLESLSWSGILVRPPEVVSPKNRVKFSDIMGELQSDDIPNADKKVASFWLHFFSALESLSDGLAIPTQNWQERGEALQFAIESMIEALNFADKDHLSFIARSYLVWIQYLKLVRVDGYKDEQIERLKPVTDQGGSSPIPLIKGYIEDKILTQLAEENSIVELIQLLNIAPSSLEILHAMRYHYHSEICQGEMLSAIIKQRKGQDDQSWTSNASDAFEKAKAIAAEHGVYSKRYGENLGGHLHRLERALNDFLQAGVPPLIDVDNIQFYVPFIYSDLKSGVSLNTNHASPLHDPRLQTKIANLDTEIELRINDPIFDNDYWQGELQLDMRVYLIGDNLGAAICKMRNSQLQSPISLRDLITFGRIFEADSNTFLRIASNGLENDTYDTLANAVAALLNNNWCTVTSHSSDVRMLSFINRLPDNFGLSEVSKLLEHLGLANFKVGRASTRLRDIGHGLQVSNGENTVISPRSTVTIANTTDNDLLGEIFTLANLWDHRIDQLWDKVNKNDFQNIGDALRELRLAIRQLSNNLPSLKAECDHIIAVYHLDGRIADIKALLE